MKLGVAINHVLHGCKPFLKKLRSTAISLVPVKVRSLLIHRGSPLENRGKVVRNGRRVSESSDHLSLHQVRLSTEPEIHGKWVPVHRIIRSPQLSLNWTCTVNQ